MSVITFKWVELDVEAIYSLIEQGERVRETPHLGGPHSHKYALTLGGLSSDVVLVDTIKAKGDNFGNTGNIDGLKVIPDDLGRGSIAASMRAFEILDNPNRTAEDVGAKLVELGVDADLFVHDRAIDLVGVHKQCVEKVVASGVTVMTFTELWRSAGDVATAILHTAAEHGRLARWYDADAGKVVMIDPSENQRALLEREGVYYGTDTGHGVLPPVAAMYAIEAVSALAEGRQATYDHMYVMSTEYTKDPEILGGITSLTEGAAAALGLSGTLSYNLLVVDNPAWDAAGGTTNHFEMIKNNQRFDWSAARPDAM